MIRRVLVFATKNYLASTIEILFVENLNLLEQDPAATEEAANFGGKREV